MKYLLIDLCDLIVLVLAFYGLLSFMATLLVLWLFFTMPKDENTDDYDGMQASLMGYAEELAREQG